MLKHKIHLQKLQTNIQTQNSLTKTTNNTGDTIQQHNTLEHL